MFKRILIVTNSFDLHADLICSRLLERDHQVFRLNLDCYPRDYQIASHYTSGTVRQQIRKLPDGEWVDLSQVGAAWVNKGADFSYRSSDLAPQELAFAELESEQALQSLLHSLDCYWLNHPRALRAAQWKGEQLRRAAGMGFRIPDTLLTNCPQQAQVFMDKLAEPMIFKAMSTPSLAAEQQTAETCLVRGLQTTLIDESMDFDAVAELPCQFQRYIAKQYELRVTVIGPHLFAAKIHSQDDERTRIDSRNMSAEIRYEATTLTPELEQRCRAFVESYGLHFGALDLIVTPENEVVFLENNPSGQFLYIEQLIPEFKMLDALADLLSKEAKCRS